MELTKFQQWWFNHKMIMYGFEAIAGILLGLSMTIFFEAPVERGFGFGLLYAFTIVASDKMSPW